MTMAPESMPEWRVVRDIAPQGSRLGVSRIHATPPRDDARRAQCDVRCGIRRIGSSVLTSATRNPASVADSRDIIHTVNQVSTVF
jgi:hypothetical protein